MPNEATDLTCPLWSRLARKLDDEAHADIMLDKAFAHPWLTKLAQAPDEIEKKLSEILTWEPNEKPAPQRGQANVAEASRFAELKRTGGSNAI
jgi:hypothetical protein